jgi:hypothetical protein
VKTLTLTLKKKSMPVEIDGTAYTLEELSGIERDTYMEDMGARIQLDANGKPMASSKLAGMQSFLVSMSLRSPDGTRVSQNIVNDWPASTVQALYDAAQDISSLRPQGADEGNDSQASG